MKYKNDLFRVPVTLQDVHVMRNSPVLSASASDSPSAATAATVSTTSARGALERQMLELQSQQAYEQEQLRHREATRSAEIAKLQFLMRNLPP